MKPFLRLAALGATVGVLLVGIGASQAQTILSAAPPEALADQAGRLIIGRGADYVPSTIDPITLFKELEGSMQKRRAFAWGVVEKMLAPQELTLLDGASVAQVPLWQTWYEGATSTNFETALLVNNFLTKLKPKIDANPAVDFRPIVDETIAEFSQKDLSSTLTDANLSSVLLQFQSMEPGLSDRLGRGTTMFSPSFIEHVLMQARGIDECDRSVDAADPPPSDDQFSHCILEFPRSAVMIKTNWEKLASGVPEHDTSASGLSAMFGIGTWPRQGGDGIHPPIRHPSRSQIYTNISKDGTEWALHSIHFVTKDVREWVWVSLWWDPDARTEDFGSDQPASLATFNGGVWQNYKMCVATAFAERDPEPWSSYTATQASLAASLEAAFMAIQKQIDEGAQSDPDDLLLLFNPGTAPQPLELVGALGPWPAPHNEQTSWCSNPNVETHPGNGRTSCIGCHQFPMTRNEERDVDMSFAHAILGDVPQFGRVKVRENFPAEFAWSFEFEFQQVIQNVRQQIGLQWP